MKSDTISRIFSECVLFPKENQQPILGQRFSEEKRQFLLDVKHKHTFDRQNQRNTNSLRSALLTIIILFAQLTIQQQQQHWGGPLLDVFGSLQLLNSAQVGRRDKAFLRSVMVGGVRIGFLLGRVRGQFVPCRFFGALDGDCHLLGECTFPPLVEIRENPEFQDLMREDKGHWPRCLLWHGWLPMLSGVNGSSPWVAD